MSPCTITLPANNPRTSPCTRILFSIGAKTTFLASVALVFLMVTSPPIVAPEFLRTNPSILITPRPMSVWEGRAIAAVLLSPTISINSLSFMFKSSMTLGSSLATPCPTSFWEIASATFNVISFSAMISSPFLWL